MAATTLPRHLRRNDRIVFLGDSITEMQMYTNYVETYLVTRYPELRLSFFNAGWGGECAPQALSRLDRDVLSLRPSLVTICYGMNDGRYGAYTDAIGEEFKTGMQALIDRLQAAGVRVVLLTPGAVDTKVNSALRQANYNANLRALADIVISLAKQHRLPFADLHALMRDVDRRGKRKDPAFSLAPVDGVHPHQTGHLVMAFGVLEALGVSPRNDEASVEVSNECDVRFPGMRVRVQRHKERTTIEITLQRLPLWVDPAARAVLPFLPFQQTFNRLRLSIMGAGPRRQLLRINHQRFGWMPNAKRSRRIDLFDIWHSNPMQDSARVGAYINEKDHVYYRVWRSLALGAPQRFPHARSILAAGKAISLQCERVREELVRSARMRIAVSIDACSSREESLDNGDFIATWAMRGPFSGAFDQDYLQGEASASASLPARAQGWKPHVFPMDDFGDCLGRLFGQLVNSSVYAAAVIASPVKQRCELRIGSDDGFAVWLNGDPVDCQLFVARQVIPDQNIAPVTLLPGKNVLLLKISQYGGPWGFCARFAKLHRPLTVLRIR